MLTEIRKTMHEQSENFDKTIEMRKYQMEIIELKDKITEKKQYRDSTSDSIKQKERSVNSKTRQQNSFIQSSKKKNK